MVSIPGAAGPGAPFPQWTVILGGSQIVGKVSNALNKAALIATSWPSTVYFFTSEAAAQNFANAHGGSAQEGPLKPVVSAAQNALNASTSALAKAANPLEFLQALFTRANAIRLAEGVLGLMLILVSVAELGKGTAIGAAVKKAPFI
jgi:hypothetical protein